MEIKLLGHDAEVEWISPQQASPFIKEDSIAVWFRFKEAVASTLSFAIDIPAKDYTKQEFIDLIRVKGENQLRDIIKRDEERKREELKRDERRKELNKLTADLGDKLGIPYHLQER